MDTIAIHRLAATAPAKIPVRSNTQPMATVMGTKNTNNRIMLSVSADMGK